MKCSWENDFLKDWENGGNCIEKKENWISPG